MACSQCHTGRAWDERGRCRPCSIGNVDLGAPFPPVGGTPAEADADRAELPDREPVPAASGPPATASEGARPPAVHTPVRPPAPVACSQCWVGEAWDDEGRCRPCSDGGVRLVPRPVDDAEEAAEQDEGSDGARPRIAALRGRRWFGAPRS